MVPSLVTLVTEADDEPAIKILTREPFLSTSVQNKPQPFLASPQNKSPFTILLNSSTHNNSTQTNEREGGHGPVVDDPVDAEPLGFDAVAVEARLQVVRVLGDLGVVLAVGTAVLERRRLVHVNLPLVVPAKVTNELSG